MRIIRKIAQKRVKELIRERGGWRARVAAELKLLPTPEARTRYRGTLHFARYELAMAVSELKIEIWRVFI